MSCHHYLISCREEHSIHGLFCANDSGSHKGCGLNLAPKGVIDIVPMIPTIHVSHFGVLEFAGTRFIQHRSVSPRFRSRNLSMTQKIVCCGDNSWTVDLLFQHDLMSQGFLSTNIQVCWDWRTTLVELLGCVSNLYYHSQWSPPRLPGTPIFVENDGFLRW